ncbi:hypothetical protein BRD01_09880 [Halobacteriales archaeon QS_8_65_32]|nr:MAG: hypothetical protein BRD01_09880 [Halobacteriales archaeon QS_8_65_32]
MERDVRRALFDDLTDCQLTALETAHCAGLYGWPRASTIEEVAESLGVAGPTFSKHRRAAERKLLSAVFDDR